MKNSNLRRPPPIGSTNGSPAAAGEQQQQSSTAAEPRFRQQVSLDAVMECVARAIFDTRRRTRSIRAHVAMATGSKGASVKPMTTATPTAGGEPSAKRPRYEPKDVEEKEDELDMAQTYQEQKTAPLIAPVSKSGARAKKKPERQTDKEKTCYANDSFFSSEAGLVADSATSTESLRWLSHYAEELKIGAYVNTDVFRIVFFEMDKISAKEEAEITRLADPNMPKKSPWRVAVLHRGICAKTFLLDPKYAAANAQCAHAMRYLCGVVKEVGTALLTSANASVEEKKALELWTGSATMELMKKCIGESDLIYFSDAVHIRRWVMLHAVLQALLAAWTEGSESLPIIDPASRLTSIDQLKQCFSEKSKKGRPKSAAAAATTTTTRNSLKSRSRRLARSGAAAAAAGGGDSDPSQFIPRATVKDPGRKWMVETAVFHILQLMDRMWWIPFRLAHGMMTALQIECPLRREFLIEMLDMSNRLMMQWHGMTDPVNEYTLGAMGSMNAVADVYRPASGTNRSRAPILYLIDKCSPSRSKIRMWDSQYPQPIRFDARQREFVLRAFLCSLMGNYRHFDIASHPGFALRSFLQMAWSRMRASANSGLGSWRFFEFMLLAQPTLLQHVIRQYMDWVCRYSDVIREHREAMHASKSDLKELEKEINAIVDRTRAMYDRARLMIFSAEVLVHDRAPTALHEVLSTIDEIIRPRSHAVMLKRNYGKSKLGFMTELRARFRAVRPVNGDISTQVRGMMRDAIDSYARRTFGFRPNGEHDYRSWPELFYNKAVATQQMPASIATIIASYLRAGFVDRKNRLITENDTISELTVAQEQFDVLREFVAHHVDPFCPKPEHVLRAILPEFGATATALEIFDAMVYGHARAQKIDPLCSLMRDFYPVTYSIIHAFASLWERRTSLMLRPLSQQQMEAQLIASRSRPDLRFFLFCQACSRIRTTVNECDRQRVTARWASNLRNVNVKREGWAPSLRAMIEKKEQSGELFETKHPRVMCNEDSRFADAACSRYGSLVKVPAIGYAIEYRNSLVIMCSFPGCGTHAVISAKRCAFWQGTYICMMCTICLQIAARRLRRVFGIVSSPWTIEMPYLDTIQKNHNELVLARVMAKERDDEQYEEQCFRTFPGMTEISQKLSQRKSLSAQDREIIRTARQTAAASRSARDLATASRKLNEQLKVPVQSRRAVKRAVAAAAAATSSSTTIVHK